MKAAKYILFGALAVLFFCGCTQVAKTSDSTVLYQGVDPIGGTENVYQVPASDMGHFIQIFSDQAWSVELSFPNPADQGWCVLSKSSGSGNDKTRLSYDQNTGPSRSVVVTAQFDTQSKEIVITQLSGGDVTPQLNSWLEMPEVPATIPANYHLITHFVPDMQGVRNYTVLYDSNLHLAVWVAYPMHKMYEGGAGRSDAWAYDPDLPTSLQFNITQTFGGGWARGHILASGSRDATRGMNIQTFYAPNIAPQAYDFNGNVWANLEANERSWEGSGKDTLYSVTGVLPKRVDIADMGYGTVTKGGITVTVPKYFYKALLNVTRSGSTVKYRAIAFWFENSNNDFDRSVVPADAITVRELERRTGLNFFSNLPQSIQNQIEDVAWNLTDWKL